MTSTPVTRCINEALPEEVFGVIFEEHAKLEWRAPVIDGQVCRRWQQTILRSPRAWAHLIIAKHFRSAPLKLHQWLDRSGSAPLHLQATNRIQGEEEVLDQHHKRIESIGMVYYPELLSVFENRSFRFYNRSPSPAGTPSTQWSAGVLGALCQNFVPFELAAFLWMPMPYH
jgi:hypothetical protein